MIETNPPPPAEVDDTDYHNGHGEAPDAHATNSLQLAYRVLAKFPEFTKRHQKFIGSVAVVGSVAVGIATLAVTRRLHHGQSPERILEEITPDELESAGKEKRQKRQKSENPQTGSRLSH